MGGSEYIPGHFLCVDHHSKSVVLAIRGSSNFRDALIDMVANYIAYKDGAVHKGMFHSTKNINGKVKRANFKCFKVNIQHMDLKFVVTVLVQE